MVAGCAITDVLCEMWPSKMIRVADRGLREGILIGLMQKRQRLMPPPGDGAQRNIPNVNGAAEVMDGP